MAIKTLSEITQDLINNIHDTLPYVDTKEGTFIRDVFINPNASEVSGLYSEIQLVRFAQSILTATDEDLDMLASNFFVERKLATRAYGSIRFFMKAPLTQEIIIPKGTQVSTLSTPTKEEKLFETLETTVVPVDYDQFDPVRPDLVYVDILAWSTFTGENSNVTANEINQVKSSLSSQVISAENPLPFTGGTDQESDLSLALRVGVALSGANIGTKDGYTSFILKQEEVVDARVVGAGDKWMTRDNREGGMVDIYVRSDRNEEHTYDINITETYVTDQIDQPAYSDIVLAKQPVFNMISLKGEIYDTSGNLIQTKVYKDGSDYLVERGTNKYYTDILWTFDEPQGTSEDAEAVRIINERLKTVNYAHNMFYSLNWGVINPDNDTVTPSDPYFLRGYYPDDGKIYQLKTKPHSTNPLVGGRFFVKKDNLWFERLYHEPDFIIVRDESDYGYSEQAKDAIRWLPSAISKPVAGEKLVVHFSYNGIIGDLQLRINEKRVLTADVLVKKARKIEVEVYAKVLNYPTHLPNTVKKSVINRVTNFINNTKKLGGTVSVSDIAYVIRGTGGVDDVGLKSLQLRALNGPPVNSLTARELEYLEIVGVTIEMVEQGIILD